MQHLTVGIALFAGAASFVSPCCLPLYPSYLSYITGVSVNRLKTESSGEIRRKTVLHTLCFIAGFSIIFYSLGLSAGLVADLFIKNRVLLRQLAALLIFFVMGLFLLGIFFQPQWLMRDVKFQWKSRPAGYAGSVLVGMGFAAGWSPCVGPILGAIITLSATESGAWLPLMTAYSLGFAVPFFSSWPFFYRFHQVDFELFQHDYENRRGPHARHGRAAVHRPNDTDHHLAAGENSRMAEVLK